LFEIYAPKDVEVSSSEVYGSVSEKFARKKYGVLKTQGMVTTPPSVVRGLTLEKFVIMTSRRVYGEPVLFRILPGSGLPYCVLGTCVADCLFVLHC